MELYRELRGGVWSLEDEEGNLFVPTAGMGANNGGKGIYIESGSVRIVREDVEEWYGYPIRTMSRTRIEALPHTAFLVDRIEVDRPVKAHSHIGLRGGGSSSGEPHIKVASEMKLVVRRDGYGIKMFQVHAAANGREQPLRLVQDAHDGSPSIRYSSEIFATRYIVVHVLAMDDTEAVKNWHILSLTDAHFYVEPPSHFGGYSLELAEDETLIVRNHDEGTEIRIGRADRIAHAYSAADQGI